MEDLVASFAVSSVSAVPNNTAAEHPYFSLYKVKGTVSSQEKRRQKILELQKLKRYDYVTHARKLATNEWDENNEEQDDGDDNEEMEWEVYRRKPSRSYKDQLMYSEWLVEVPSDLATEWLLTLCPVGKRSLVVASKGNTKVYAKSGYLINTFASYLPGGSKSEKTQTHGYNWGSYSLLDCIYNEIQKTYYVLDVMCWNSHPLFDSETEFRVYWMHTKFQENPNVMKNTSGNPYKFIPLQYHNCDENTLREVLWSPMPFSCKLDGLLFYHKRTHYTSGTTPLVGWLKAYMVPEMLHIDVPASLTSDKPISYTTMREHVPAAFEKHEKQKEEENKMKC